MSQYKRTNKIYGNCLVKAPDGTDMFRCEMKKANWYLERNLANIISEEPFEIQLTFEPNGKGHINDEYYLSKKENRCVVCGTTDLAELTKHHIVPYEYRKHFPNEFKEHASHDVCSICKEHHTEYETQFALTLKKILADLYHAPLNVTENEKKVLLSYSYASALQEHGEKMNKERRDEMLAYITLFHGELDDKKIKKLADTDVTEVLDLGRHHGETVYKNVKDKLQEFVEMWRKDFVNAMNPKYMPKGWRIERPIGKHTVKAK